MNTEWFRTLKSRILDCRRDILHEGQGLTSGYSCFGGLTLGEDDSVGEDDRLGVDGRAGGDPASGKRRLRTRE